MKDSLKSLILVGTILGLGMGLFACVKQGVLFGVIFGIIMGALFGLIMGVFLYFQSKYFKKNSKKITGKGTIVFEGGANHFKGAEAVGGWLYLTNEELIFQSGIFNIRNHKLVVPLDQIISVRTSLTRCYIPNGLQVTTNDGVEKFIVSKRKEWVRRLSEDIRSATPPPY